MTNTFGKFLVLLCLLLSIRYSHAQNDSNGTNRETGDQKNTTAQLSVEQQAANSDYYKANCDRPKDHDAADLCEQRRMAKASEESVWWSEFQSILGIFGFGGVLGSLIFTGFGSIVAARQVRLSRHALVSTERAFCFPKITNWSARVDIKTRKVVDYLVSVVWENTGNTPPRYVRMQTNRILIPDLLPDDFDFSRSDIIQDIPAMIPPGGTIESTQLVVTLDEIEEVMAGKQQLYFWGWIEYDDIFERTPRHRTEFCHKWWLGGDPRLGGDPEHRERFSTRYTTHNRHNGADEECDYPVKTASPKRMGR